MSMLCLRSKLGVSEYISAIILVVIVLGALTLVYAHFNAVMSLSEALFSRSLTEYSVNLRSLLVVTATYVSSEDVLHVVVATGEYPVEIYGVYVDEVLLEDCPTHEFKILRPYDVVEIACRLPEASEVIRVKISYNGGLIEVLSSKV
ncbi:MAG: hypothetical protein QW417_00745 [Zestosphaera sp.]